MYYGHFSGSFSAIVTFTFNFPNIFFSNQLKTHNIILVKRRDFFPNPRKVEVQSPQAESVPWRPGPAWRAAWTPWWPCGPGPSPPASQPPALPSRHWGRPQRRGRRRVLEGWGTWRGGAREVGRWVGWYLEAHNVNISGEGLDWEICGSQPVTMWENRENTSECLAAVFRL